MILFSTMGIVLTISQVHFSLALKYNVQVLSSHFKIYKVYLITTVSLMHNILLLYCKVLFPLFIFFFEILQSSGEHKGYTVSRTWHVRWTHLIICVMSFKVQFFLLFFFFAVVWSVRNLLLVSTSFQESHQCMFLYTSTLV